MSKSLATWFTPSLQVFQRSKGRSAVAAAAYRACVKLEDERIGLAHDYTRKLGHVSTELFGVEGLDLTVADIGTLWNAAEKAETRQNSAVARELMVPLSNEWTDEQRRQCVRGLSEMLVARYGVAVMASIHRPAHGQNDHVHIQFTTRTVDRNMDFGKKTRILDDAKTGEVKKLREEVCRIVNEHAEQYGNDWYVYAGKFCEIEGMEEHISTKHVPRLAAPEVIESIKTYNADVIEYRALKGEQKKIEEERVQLERDIADDLKREEEKREYYVAEVPVVAPVVKSNLFFDPNSKDEVFISREYRIAHEKQERLLFQKLDLERQQEEWLKLFKEKKKEEPAHEFNFIKRETRKSKERHAAWVDEINDMRRGYQECSKKLDERKTALADETLQKNAEAYRAATAHNERIKQERENELNARIEQQRLEREAAEKSNRADWGAGLDEFNHRSQSQTSSIGYSM